MIPKRLEDWNYAVIEALVKKNINESDRHDFKHDLPDADTLTRISCAFANTKGGFIVLGVKERGLNFIIGGIHNDKELAHRFGQRISAQPTIDFDLPKVIVIPHSDKVLVVFHIPLSDERPHISSHAERRIFWKRTNKGNTEMTYEEIRMSFQRYEERREKLKLLYMELIGDIETLNDMKVSPATSDISKTYSVLTLDSTIITSLLTDLYPIVGKHTELIRSLFTIRRTIQSINIKARIFHSQLAFPLTNKDQTVKDYNEYTNEKIDLLIPIVERAVKILEKRFNLHNPLRAEST